ncbi:MAG: hypothetical protein WC525_10025 [Candidatus Thermoplasmatota archaeon]
MTNPVILQLWVNRALSNVDFAYNKKLTSRELSDLRKYLRDYGCKIPKLPEREEDADDVLRMMVRFWLVRESLTSMCTLFGEDTEP